MYKLFFFLCIFPFFSFAQIEEKADNDFVNMIRVGGDIFSAPFKFENYDWGNASITAAATMGAFFLDEPVRDFIQNNKTPFLSALQEVDDIYHIIGIAGASVGIYGYGLAAKDSRTRNLGLKLVEATLYGSALNLLLKALIGRSRPFMDRGNSTFSPFKSSFDETAFPSGHTTLAFAFSTVMANHNSNISWQIGWYTSAALVGWARMYRDYHWFSDVLLGAAIGYFIGEFVSSHRSNQTEIINTVELPEPDFSFSFSLPLR